MVVKLPSTLPLIALAVGSIGEAITELFPEGRLNFALLFLTSRRGILFAV